MPAEKWLEFKGGDAGISGAAGVIGTNPGNSMDEIFRVPKVARINQNKGLELLSSSGKSQSLKIRL